MGKGDGPEDIKGSANILGAIGMRARLTFRKKGKQQKKEERESATI